MKVKMFLLPALLCLAGASYGEDAQYKVMDGYKVDPKR